MSFLYFCRQAGLSREDMEEMTIGMCIEYIDIYVEFKNPDSKSNTTRQATQDDFANF